MISICSFDEPRDPVDLNNFGREQSTRPWAGKLCRHGELIIPILKIENLHCYTLWAVVDYDETPKVLERFESREWHSGDEFATYLIKLPSHLLVFCATEFESAEMRGEIRVYHVTNQLQLDNLIAERARANGRFVVLGYADADADALSLMGLAVGPTPSHLFGAQPDELREFSMAIDRFCEFETNMRRFGTEVGDGVLEKLSHSLPRATATLLGLNGELTDEFGAITETYVEGRKKHDARAFISLIVTEIIASRSKISTNQFETLLFARIGLGSALKTAGQEPGYEEFYPDGQMPKASANEEVVFKWQRELERMNESLRPTLTSLDLAMMKMIGF